MSHTNSTPNYNLPQFLGTDKPAWLSDINNAMAAIDAAIAAAKSAADSADAAASALGITVGNHTTQLGTLSGAVVSQGNTLNTVTALIGNGTPTTTDQTIIGAVNELHADQGDLADLTTTDKSSLVDAINELKDDAALKVIAEVTGDGVKTYATLLSELYGMLPAGFSYDKSIMKLDNDIWQSIGGGLYTRSAFTAGYGFRGSTINLVNHTYSDIRYSVAAPPVATETDLAATVPVNGYKIRVMS